MSTHRYKIVCQKCFGQSIINIQESNLNKYIIWDEVDQVISGRPRLDGYFGWQCLCGNNSLLSKQENRVIKDKQNPSPKDINQVIRNLAVPNAVEGNNSVTVDGFELVKL